MDIRTQIGGGYGAEYRTVYYLKDKLQSVDITVTHPIGDGPLVVNRGQVTADGKSWSLYELHLDYYLSIINCDVHIVFNRADGHEGGIDADMARGILYSMVKRRPIIMLFAPLFLPGVDLFSQELIMRHLNQIIISDLTALDETDTRNLLCNVASQPLHYGISNHEAAYINAAVRAYFRRFFELQEEGQDGGFDLP